MYGRGGCAKQLIARNTFPNKMLPMTTRIFWSDCRLVHWIHPIMIYFLMVIWNTHALVFFEHAYFVIIL